MMRLRERDRIVCPQTIHSPTTTMSNDKVDQWVHVPAAVAAVAAMSSDKVDHAVPVRERDRIVCPQTIHSPTTTTSNDKVDQWMQAVAAMSSDKVDHAVPVRTHTPPHAVPSRPTAHPLRPLAHLS